MTREDGIDDRTSWFSGRARLVQLRRHVDERGALLPLEFGSLPFVPQRLFTVSGVAAGIRRGGHGHRTAQQLLVCLQGRVDLCLRLDDEEAQVSLRADGPGMLIGPRVWCQQTYAAADTVLLVLSDELYDSRSYVTGWQSG